MELTRRMKMARFQLFWSQMRKNKPLDESRKTGQTSGTKMSYTLFIIMVFFYLGPSLMRYCYFTKCCFYFQDKHDMQTKADTVKRLVERGYRVKCMAVVVPNEDTQKQNLAGLLSRLAALIEDFSIVESGPKIEAKQAYIVVRHSKFGPLKKGTCKKNVLEILNSSISKQSLEEEQSLNEADSNIVEDTDSETETELDSTDDFDQNQRVKVAPEVINRYEATKQTNGSENRYATTRPTNGPGVRRRFEPESQSQHQSQNPNNRRGDFSRRGPGESASGYGMFDAPKPNNDSQRDSGPVEVKRYQKGPRPQVPTSRGDYSIENTNMNPGGVRDKQASFRR
ncbi:putative translation initiation factor 3 [Helianthus anomalus]